MTRNRRLPIVEWLDAERAGDEDVADRHFSSAMQALGRMAPPPGFTDRVLVAAGVVRPAAGLLASRWARAATVGGMSLAGLGVLALPLGAVLLNAPSTGARFIVALAGWVARAADLAGALFGTFRLVVQVGDALQLAASTPSVLAAVAISLVLATGSLAALGRLLAPTEELTCS